MTDNNLERLHFVDHDMDQKGVSFLLSPTMSGKTIFSSILANHLIKRGRNVVNINKFDKYWKTEVGLSWSECIDSRTPTDVIIDDTHMLSTTASFFWEYIRNFLRSPFRHPYLRFLILGCYFDVDSILGIDAGNDISPTSPIPPRVLNLNKDEYEKLVHMVNIKNGCTIPGPIQQLVFKYTLGYVGLAGILLDIYVSESHQYSQVKEMLKVTTSRRLLAQVGRCIRRVARFTLAERSLLIDMLYMSDERSSTTDEGFLVKRAMDPNVRKTIKGLKTYGIIIEGESPNHVEFVAPVFKILLGQQLFWRLTNRSIQVLPHWYEFEELIHVCLSHMRPEILRVSLSDVSLKGTRRILIMEFLTHLATAIVEFGLATAFVGPTVGVNGLFLDIHVSNLEWGIDILREGDNLPEYAHDVIQGRCHESPLNKWAILYFCQDGELNLFKALEEGYWCVVCREDMTTATLKRKGYLDVHINFGETSLYDINE
ncbi:hypothetical protein BDQ17DRAFT_1329631 [Cyathus striatus]|nr:hypothetical protein BDQ17DRAFT_1329631 [Cyathus striatus]